MGVQCSGGTVPQWARGRVQSVSAPQGIPHRGPYCLGLLPEQCLILSTPTTATAVTVLPESMLVTCQNWLLAKDSLSAFEVLQP